MNPSMEGEVVLTVRRLDLEGALAAITWLNERPSETLYTVDFRELEWIEPFGMLIFSRHLRAFADQAKPARFRSINHQQNGYAAHMGLFQSFGLDHGNDPGEVPGTTNYVPITNLGVSELRGEAKKRFQDPREVIEARCQGLAKILVRDNDQDVQDTLSYCLREIFRNVFEHSKADTVWYAAQYWPSKELVELSVLDQGVGVRKALSRNPHLDIATDEDAIRLALLPGISGVAFEGGKRQRNDPWANSGYGLFMTSLICARGGSFTVCSGTRGLSVTGDTESTFDVGFDGTALRLEVFLPNVSGLKKTLNELRERGDSIVGGLRRESRITASMSSRMLSKDFRR